MDRSNPWLANCKGGAVETPLEMTRRDFVAGGVALAAARRGFAATPAGQEFAGQEFTESKHRTMDIKRNGSRPSGNGPEAWFTGTVRVDPVFQVGDPTRLSGGRVTFEPGARTMWHTHPLGQTLVVTSGLGW